MAAANVHSDLEAQENKIYFHFFPFYLPWSDWTACCELSGFLFFFFFIKVSFFTLPFTLIKRVFFFFFIFKLYVIVLVFSYTSLSSIFKVSTAYLRLLIFLPAVLIPDYNSVRPALLMMYPAYKLNKQGQNIQPSCTAFPV